MDGRNKSFIQISSKSSNVSMEIHVKNRIALIIIVKLIESTNFLIGLDISLKQELSHFQQTSTSLY